MGLGIAIINAKARVRVHVNGMQYVSEGPNEFFFFLMKVFNEVDVFFDNI